MIVISEIPYNVNKSELVKSIADLAIEKKDEGINNVKDLSSDLQRCGGCGRHAGSE